MVNFMWGLFTFGGCQETPQTVAKKSLNSTQDTSADEITFYRDVQPIIQQNCVSCHQDDGQGIGDFTNPTVVQQMAGLIYESVISGQMPPPAADPACRNYINSEILHLSQEKKDIIEEWFEAGSPMGDINDKQPSQVGSVELENPDLILHITEPYTPTFDDANNPGNEYRCFSIQHGRDEPFYITGMHPIIDQAGIVHHIVLAKADADGIVNGSDQPGGASCIHRGGAFIRDFEHGMMLSGWAPGTQPVILEEGAGMAVQPDEYIVIQMHYYQNADLGSVPDQSGYAFTTTTEVEHNVIMLPLGIQDFRIPAGEESYTATGSIQMPLGFRLWGVFPHMHVLGSAYEFSIEQEDGDQQCVARSDNFDFENQLNYIYKKSIKADPDSKFKISCTWNNSADNPNIIHNPPVDVQYGERTDEEMCYAFSLVSFE